MQTTKPPTVLETIMLKEDQEVPNSRQMRVSSIELDEYERDDPYRGREQREFRSPKPRRDEKTRNVSQTTSPQLLPDIA